MSAASHRKEYFVILIWLVVLTVLEVVIAQIDIGKGMMVSGLVLMAVAKAVLVALFYMHLKQETPILRRSVSFCLSIPVIYAFVLIGEATWRMLR